MSDGFRRRASLCGLMFAPRPTGITPLCGVFPVGGALKKQKPFAVQKCFFHFPSACKRACAEENEKAVLLSRTAFVFLAEREGFEPPEPRSSTVFKTAAIDHSATSPFVIGMQRYVFFPMVQKFWAAQARFLYKYLSKRKNCRGDN